MPSLMIAPRRTSGPSRTLSQPHIVLILLGLFGVNIAPVTRAGGAVDADGPGKSANTTSSLNADTPLPRDPNNVYGRFDNGLKYIVRRNANPPGKVSVNLHVATGALNESDQQNGLAHFIEHMAFNGSTHFKPGELIPLMNKMGMVFGADSNAHTTFHETVYKLSMPDVKPETLDLAFTILSDYAYGLTLPANEIERERGVILEESRTHKSAAERLRRKVMQEVFAGTRLEKHDVMGDEQQIKTFPRETFLDYWNTWYRPENMTLIVAGDVNADEVVTLARTKLGSFQARSAEREAQRAGLRPTETPRAFVFTDPEQAGAELSLMNIRPGRPPTSTVGDFRFEVIEDLATGIVNRRLDNLVRGGNAPFRNAGIDIGDFLNEVRIAEGEANGEPKDWNSMLDVLVAEVARAIDHGFTRRELELARAAMLAGAERAAQTESTRDSQMIVAMLSASVGRKLPILSAQQRLDLTRSVLDTVTTDELHRAFVSDFKARNWTYVLTLPQSAPDLKQPTSEEVLAAAAAAWTRKTQPPEDLKLGGSILPSEPEPGQVASTETDAELKLTTVTFTNGVVMHHKFVDYKKDSVTVQMTLPGGMIEETAENHGISEAASLALRRPATSRFTSSQVRDLMVGKNVGVGGSIGLDAMKLVVAGSREHLASGMQLAFAILTDGMLEQSALDEWKKRQSVHYEQARKEPEGRLSEAMALTLYGGDVRFSTLTPELIHRQDRSQAEAWFKRIATRAAIEVAVVGDLPLDDAVALVGRYVGSLPRREGTLRSLDGLRKLDRGPGPFEKSVKFETVTPKALVVAGVIGVDDNSPDRRPLSLAALVLSDRMNERIREKEQLVYSIGASNRPGIGIPGTGLFGAEAPTDPHNAKKLADTIIEMIHELAKTGPTDAELDVAKKQVANILSSDMKEPAFWLSQIGELRYRQRKLQDIKQLPDVFQTYTAEQVRDVMAKYARPERVLRVVIAPEEQPDAAGKSDSNRSSQPAPMPAEPAPAGSPGGGR